MWLPEKAALEARGSVCARRRRRPSCLPSTTTPLDDDALVAAGRRFDHADVLAMGDSYCSSEATAEPPSGGNEQPRRRCGADAGATEPSAWNSKSSGRLPPCLRCSSCIRAGWLCRFTTRSVWLPW